ncbi:MAG: hypothetical protein HY597_02915 [Candidatus Omnitrophica bacterium]|nr:hypothetical protein [Candidatus Omnitrophota bacterium]
MRAAAAAVALLATLLGGAAAHAAETEPPEITITGELIDLKCYGTMGLQGAIHQECAAKCAREHWPVAVLEEKEQRLYPLVVPPAAVADAAGSQVRVTGTVLMGSVILLPSRLEVEHAGAWSDVPLPNVE